MIPAGCPRFENTFSVIRFHLIFPDVAIGLSQLWVRFRAHEHPARQC